MSLQIPDDIRSLMMPWAAAIEPYDPDFSPVEVNLSANENSFGIPVQLASAVAEAIATTPMNRYPSARADRLREVLAERHVVTPDQVVVGNGGDELIFNLFLAFGGVGRTLIDCPPTFSVYRTYAELVGTSVVDVPRTATFDVDAAALYDAALAHSADITVITTPNNPTGNTLSTGAIAAICDACPGIVLVDQAYAEFAEPDFDTAELLDIHPNLVILHTFSKAFALAGLRIGYVLASPGIAAALTAVRQPYSVNALAQAAATAMVVNRDGLTEVIDEIVHAREELYAVLSELSDLGVTVYPSQGNFLLVRVPDAISVWQRLRDEHSVLVRNVSGAPGLDGCLRITVGTPDENTRLLAGLLSILE